MPHHLSVVDDSWDYFFLSIRPWFFGGLLAVSACAVIGILTTRRRVHRAMGLVLLLWSNGLTLFEQFVLGSW